MFWRGRNCRGITAESGIGACAATINISRSFQRFSSEGNQAKSRFEMIWLIKVILTPCYFGLRQPGMRKSFSLWTAPNMADLSLFRLQHSTFRSCNNNLFHAVEPVLIYSKGDLSMWLLRHFGCGTARNTRHFCSPDIGTMFVTESKTGRPWENTLLKSMSFDCFFSSIFWQ